MRSRFRDPLAFLSLAAIVAVLVLVTLVLLPHDPYIRFQELARESVHYLRIKWIYERVHYDETPVDVAFIGTSHMQSGIDSARVETTLRANGNALHVVNFAIPHLGRDLEYLVARELLDNKKPKLLVIETQFFEARAPHPGFQRLATLSDIATAPMIINTGLIENLVRLPLRQLDLFTRSLAPKRYGMFNTFDRARYEGAHFNDTYLQHGFTATRTAVHRRDFFEPQLAGIRTDITEKSNLASRVNFAATDHNVLYRYNNIYLDRIVSLAKSQGVRVVFLYLPFLEGPGMPQHAAWINSMGQIMTPTKIIGNAALWQNADHLNYFGALALSDWVAGELPVHLKNDAQKIAVDSKVSYLKTPNNKRGNKESAREGS